MVPHDELCHLAAIAAMDDPKQVNLSTPLWCRQAQVRVLLLLLLLRQRCAALLKPISSIQAGCGRWRQAAAAPLLSGLRCCCLQPPLLSLLLLLRLRWLQHPRLGTQLGSKRRRAGRLRRHARCRAPAGSCRGLHRGCQ
jgi:hypothetical protein